jgi:transposase InsO family protein
VIKGNAHRYPVSAQCEILNVARATYYRNKDCQEKPDRDAALRGEIEDIFNENRRVYGSRKIKAVLHRRGKKVSVRRIRRNMKQLGISSVYTKKQYKSRPGKANNTAIPNVLAREFDGRAPFEVIVSDLTYVRVAERWQYVCILLDLHNREIAGYSAGPHKDAMLVKSAFAKVKGNLLNVSMFHTDRGSEFDNTLIDGVLLGFGIERSLSMKGTPHDNAVAESAFKTIKTEFTHRMTFDSLNHLQRELDAYVYWYNNKRLHGKLGYLSPIEYKENKSNDWTGNFKISDNPPQLLVGTP